MDYNDSHACNWVIYGFCIRHRVSPLQIIHGTLYALATPVENVSVDHRRFHVLVAEKLLDRPDIVTAFEKLRGEGMTQRVAGGAFGQTGFSHRAGNCFLDDGFVNMMASFFAGFRISPAVFLWENPLPAPFLGGVGVFPVERVGQEHTPPAFRQVALVDCLAPLQMLLKRRLERFGQHSDAVLRAFAVAIES